MMRLTCLLSGLVFSTHALAAPPPDYLRDIKPLLSQKCGSCHGAVTQEAGLRLDAGTLIHKGSNNGPVVVPERPEVSSLIERVSTADDDLRMPPHDAGEPLTAEQIAVLQAWIASGASWPQQEAIPAGPDDHWAYRIPVRPELPAVLPGMSPHPIDRLIQVGLNSAGLQALPAADKSTLLRRVCLDLTGLPPTRAQQREFLADESADAWPRLVDRLLASQAYGERWGRHWMDIWRYSDWDGYQEEVRGSQRHIWHWRDWIIESLNHDKGYDQMILEMLAADEAAPADVSDLRATGYLARSFHNSNRDIWLDATVEHTAKAFLAMTVNCARCHDHKYDPIRQPDYYAFRAIFEPHHVRTERLPGQADIAKDGLVRAFDKSPDAQTFLYVSGNEKQPDKDNPIAPSLPSFLDIPFEPESVGLPPTAAFPALRDYVRQEDLAAARQKLSDAEQALQRYRDAVSQQESAAAGELKSAELPSPAAFPEAEDAILPTVPTVDAVLQQHVTAAAAALASLRARWAADAAKYADPPHDSELRQHLAEQASVAEHHARISQTHATALQHKLDLLRAVRDSNPDNADTQKAVEQARKTYQASARAALDAGYGKEPGQLPTDGKYTSVGESYPSVSTGRRLALAKWITDRQNPLTARVAVNHIWMRHFGEPLVPNVFDFGLKTPRPVQADLLDWLAVEFMDHEFSMKHLHRLILTSAAFRRASSGESALTALNRQTDPDNALLWKANVRRLEAEVIRDSMLHVCGGLDTTTGGPDLDFHNGDTILRRSVYFRHAYEKQMTMLVIFDAAGPAECYRRSPSIVPQQALAVSNSPLTFDQARRLAARLTDESRSTAGENSEAGGHPSQEQSEHYIQAAFETVLGRPCTASELQVCRDFLSEQARLLTATDQLTAQPGTAVATTPASSDPALRARENLIHVLLNHNDFVTVR